MKRLSDVFDRVPSSMLKLVIVVGVLVLPATAVIVLSLHDDAKPESVAAVVQNGDTERERERAAREGQLALENERLKQQIEILRLEQVRRDKELEYSAQERDRLLRIEERRQDLAEREIQADRKHIDRSSDREYVNQTSQDVINNANRTVELQKDAAAARLGITRAQYNALESEKWRESSGLR